MPVTNAKTNAILFGLTSSEYKFTLHMHRKPNSKKKRI